MDYTNLLIKNLKFYFIFRILIEMLNSQISPEEIYVILKQIRQADLIGESKKTEDQ